MPIVADIADEQTGEYQEVKRHPNESIVSIKVLLVCQNHSGADCSGERTLGHMLFPLSEKMEAAMKVAAAQKVPITRNNKASPCRTFAETVRNMAMMSRYSSHNVAICQRLLKSAQPSAFSKGKWVKTCMPIDVSGYSIIAGSLPVRRGSFVMAQCLDGQFSQRAAEYRIDLFAQQMPLGFFLTDRGLVNMGMRRSVIENPAIASHNHQAGGYPQAGEGRLDVRPKARSRP